MAEFLFRWPADTPEMTFESLAARLSDLCDRANCLADTVQIGTTVELRWHGRDHSAVMVRLYSTTIAVLADDGTIRFPNDDPHMTTREWIGKIIYDNGLGGSAWRIRRRASDGQGPAVARGSAGLLCIDGDRDKPVHGPVHRVDRDRIARNQENREQWAAEMAFRSLHPDEWDADLAAAKPHQGMPDYRPRVDARYWQDTRHRPSLSDIR
jgi:hypothetical protein